MESNLRAYFAEFLGTACLIFVGCGSIAIGGYGPSFPTGALPVALAFGLCLTFLIYAIGPTSGCHVNPAITIGLWAANRFSASKIAGYVIAQCAGGVAGAALLAFILQGKANSYNLAASGLGQNGWGPGYLGNYGTAAAFLSEVVTTFIFMVAIVGVSMNEKAKEFAGISIGFALTAIILVFINVTGVSLNPARSLGPAVLVGGTALTQVWLFLIAPVIGAVLGGVVYRAPM